VSAFESAIHQWQRGERRLAQAQAERAPLLTRVTDVLVAELRRRLGGRFSSEELAELYNQGTTWCLQLAMDTAPQHPWAWDSSIVVDAAFARYLREAVDYAGGRRIPAKQ
jgi:DNA-binding transcriptional regulator YdaS (Cro superfamily)